MTESLSNEAMRNMSVLGINKLFKENGSRSFEDSDDVLDSDTSISERESIYYEALGIYQKQQNSNQ